jgi:hypothetical protein
MLAFGTAAATSVAMPLAGCGDDSAGQQPDAQHATDAAYGGIAVDSTLYGEDAAYGTIPLEDAGPNPTDDGAVTDDADTDGGDADIDASADDAGDQ